MKRSTLCSGILALSLCLLFTPVPGHGVTWELTRLRENLGGIPAELTNVDGTVFFAVRNPSSFFPSSRLWKTDGSPSGTVMVKDVDPGNDGLIASLTNVNGTLFFVATDASHGRELWKSDGTEAGTVLVKDIYPGGNSNPDWLTNVNGTLFFKADDGTHGSELWKSDGTEAGTVMVKDVIVPDLPSFGIDPGWLTNVNDVLFFSAKKEGWSGDELWRSDGTAAGTRLIKDINPGSDGSTPMYLKAIGSLLFFSADDGTHGKELWKSDGTEAGTELVKDIWFDSVDSEPKEITQYGFSVMFSATREDQGRELWTSIAGLEASTMMVKDIADHYLHPDSNPEYLTENKAMLYFAAYSFYAGGRELWKSNGTATGTVMVKDIHPSGDSNPEHLTSSNGYVFFTADDGVHGEELWVSDGTAAGTAMVRDIDPTDGSNPKNLLDVNGTLYFFASGIEWELWKCEEEFPWILFYPAMIHRE